MQNLALLFSKRQVWKIKLSWLLLEFVFKAKWTAVFAWHKWFHNQFNGCEPILLLLKWLVPSPSHNKVVDSCPFSCAATTHATAQVNWSTNWFSCKLMQNKKGNYFQLDLHLIFKICKTIKIVETRQATCLQEKVEQFHLAPHRIYTW